MRTLVFAVTLIASFAFALAPATASAQQTPATTQPATQKIPDTLVSFDLVRIPAGTIDGQEVRPFWIGATEVTWDAYDVFAYRLDMTPEQQAAGVDAESRPSKPYGAPDRGFGHQGYPAIGIAAPAAEAYCAWLSAKTGHTYRLPTEAEWELACRAGDASQLDPRQQAWFDMNARGKTHEVATKQPNTFGLYDMLGNASEWVVTPDGEHVTAGGSFLDPVEDMTCGTRAEYDEMWQDSDPQEPKSRWWLSDAPMVGFRVVREE